LAGKKEVQPISASDQFVTGHLDRIEMTRRDEAGGSNQSEPAHLFSRRPVCQRARPLFMPDSVSRPRLSIEVFEAYCG
jgi:hypothetical protein